MPPLQPIRSASLKSQVVTSIREAIFDGHFALGEALRELHLARDLQVSQPTIREALLELEKQGLVVRTPNIGTTVTNMTTEELRGRLEVRMALERMAAEKAAAAMGQAEFEELERRLERFTRITAANSYYEAAQADLEFHRWIWQCSGNAVLADTLDHIVAPLFAFISVLRSAGSQDLRKVVLSHAPIVAALRNRDLPAIERELNRNIWDSYSEFLESGVADCRTYAERNATPLGAGAVSGRGSGRRQAEWRPHSRENRRFHSLTPAHPATEKL